MDIASIKTAITVVTRSSSTKFLNRYDYDYHGQWNVEPLRNIDVGNVAAQYCKERDLSIRKVFQNPLTHSNNSMSIDYAEYCIQCVHEVVKMNIY